MNHTQSFSRLTVGRFSSSVALRTVDKSGNRQTSQFVTPTITQQHFKCFYSIVVKSLSVAAETLGNFITFQLFVFEPFHEILLQSDTKDFFFFC